jgi:GntR family transcriptional regulator/MocR family aminotransferase
LTDLHLRIDKTAGRLGGQVATELRLAIREKRLSGGTRLPSSRDLASDLGVSRGVVVAAYEQLVAEGFLTARSGDGTRVATISTRPDPQKPLEVQSDRRRPGAEAPADYDLRLGRPDLAAFPRERWLSAMKQVLRTLPHQELAYPDPAGSLVLRTELAGYLGRVRSAVVAPAQIVITGGVAHGLSMAVRLLGRTLALEDPTSTRQIPLLEASGVRLVRVPVDEEGIDVAALARTPARAVLLTPAHQFPTGVVLSPRRRAELISWVRAVDGVIIEDDYDAEFRYDREPVGCLQGVDPDRVVLLGSVSKALAPALRLGWMAAPSALAAAAADYRAMTDLGSPVIEQHALAHLIASGAYDRQLRLMRRTYRSRRDALVSALHEHLPGARVSGISAGLHLYVELPPRDQEAALYEKSVTEAALALGVAVEPSGQVRTGGRRAALVLGYSGLNEKRLAEAAELLGRALRL